MFLRYQRLQHVFECCLLVLTQLHNSFVTRLLPADDTLFEVDPEIRCSGVSSRYCCYGSHTLQLVLSQINYFFIVVNRELIRSFCAKSY